MKSIYAVFLCFGLAVCLLFASCSAVSVAPVFSGGAFSNAPSGTSSQAGDSSMPNAGVRYALALEEPAQQRFDSFAPRIVSILEKRLQAFGLKGRVYIQNGQVIAEVLAPMGLREAQTFGEYLFMQATLRIAMSDGTTPLTSDNIQSAQLYARSPSCEPNANIILLTFTQDGADILYEATAMEAQIHGNLEISFDGLLLYSPLIEEPVQDGKLFITGAFDQTGAQTLVNMLNCGALPCGVQIANMDLIEE